MPIYECICSLNDSEQFGTKQLCFLYTQYLINPHPRGFFFLPRREKRERKKRQEKEREFSFTASFSLFFLFFVMTEKTLWAQGNLIHTITLLLIFVQFMVGQLTVHGQPWLASHSQPWLVSFFQLWEWNTMYY